MKSICTLLCFLSLFRLYGQSSSLNNNYITVSEIRAEVNGENIIISWNKAKNNLGLQYQLYQHTQPINRSNFHMATVVTLLGPEIQRFRIPLKRNESLWFAVLTVRAGAVIPIVNLGQNSTIAGITTVARPNAVSGVPVLSNSSMTVVLSEDTHTPTDQTHSKLIDIVNQYLLSGSWQVAKEKLFILKATSTLNDLREARIAFYLAQCDYYLGNFRDSYLSFLVSSTFYPNESNVWLEKLDGKIPGIGVGRPGISAETMEKR